MVRTTVAAGGQWLISAFPYAGSIVGSAMIVLGLCLLLTHKSLGLVAGRQAPINPQRNLGNAFLFGIVYAVASLSCALPIFLAVVGGTLASQGLLRGLDQFLWYALGMGTVIFVVMIGAAVARPSVARWPRTLTPYVHRVSAMFLIGAGVHLVYYWLFQGGLVFWALGVDLRHARHQSGNGMACPWCADS